MNPAFIAFLLSISPRPALPNPPHSLHSPALSLARLTEPSARPARSCSSRTGRTSARTRPEAAAAGDGAGPQRKVAARPPRAAHAARRGALTAIQASAQPRRRRPATRGTCSAQPTSDSAQPRTSCVCAPLHVCVCHPPDLFGTARDRSGGAVACPASRAGPGASRRRVRAGRRGLCEACCSV